MGVGGPALFTLVHRESGSAWPFASPAVASGPLLRDHRKRRVHTAAFALLSWLLLERSGGRRGLATGARMEHEWLPARGERKQSPGNKGERTTTTLAPRPAPLANQILTTHTPHTPHTHSSTAL